MNPLKKKHRDYKSLLQGAQILLTLAVAIGVLFSSAPTANGFIAFDHFYFRIMRKFNNLIRRVHKDQWVIGYAYMDNCPPEARKNGPAIEEVITQALNAWLQPVRDLNTGKPVVSDFRFVPNFEVRPKDLADLLLYDLNIFFFCEHEISVALVGVDMAIPPGINMRQGTGTDVNPRFAFVILHEIGHTFGLLDTYRRLELEREELRVSRGGLERTIGHQPASVMSALNLPRPIPTRISQDDANGIVWLYKFYHENLPLEDCIFPDYELETSPDGCRPKYPLIFEIKHSIEGFAIQVIDQDRNTDVNARDAEGSTALFWAAKRGYYDLADRLVVHKDIDIRDADGTAALKEAAKQGHRDIVNLFLEHTDDWTVVDKTSPRHQRSVFYLVPEPRRGEPLVFHAGYLGRVPGGDVLFVAQKREDALIETYFGDLALVGYQGIVGQNINIREVAAFPGANGETGVVLLAIRDISFVDYPPLQLAAYPALTDGEVELLTYKSDAGIVLEGKDPEKRFSLPLQVRGCASVSQVGLADLDLGQHTCGPVNSVSEGSLLFDKEKGTLIGFYREQDVKEILGDGLPLADAVSEALIRLVDAKPVSPKNRLTTTWAALKTKE